MSSSILYLSPGVFDKGGISRYCRYQVRALRELLGEHAIDVLSLAPPTEESFEEPFEVDLASSGPSGRGKIVFAFAALLAALEERPRLVWAAHAHFAALSLALAAPLRARVLLNVYGAEVWTDITPVRRASIRQADWLISDCHATLRHVIADKLHGPNQTTVHWDCVDVERFQPGTPGNVLERLGVPQQRGMVTVLTLARLSREEGHKGVDRLLRAVAKLQNRPVRVVVAGGGTWLPELRYLASQVGLEGRVHFTGPVSEADLVDVYRSCDLFALVTDKRPGGGEGLPLTPIEAAACEKPVLVGNQDGSVEAVEDGITGYICDSTDLEDIASRIRQLADDPVLRRDLGRCGREKILRDMSYDRFRERLRELLETMGLTTREVEGKHDGSSTSPRN